MKFPPFEPIDLKNAAQSFEAIDLSLSQIQPDGNQPRKNFDALALNELSLSIKQHGIIQPIIVKKMDGNHKFQIIAGERRFRAAKLAGLEKIPAIIKEYDNTNSMAVSLIENIQRENLNPLEEAQAIQSLLEKCYMTHNQVAESLGKSRTTITNLTRLLSLSTTVKEMITAGSLEMGHARALLSLSEIKQIELAELIVKKSLSVRKTEKMVQSMHMPSFKSDVIVTPQLENKIKEWDELLAKQFPSKADVQMNTHGKGKVVIHFDSVEEAHWLMERLRKI